MRLSYRAFPTVSAGIPRALANNLVARQLGAPSCAPQAFMNATAVGGRFERDGVLRRGFFRPCGEPICSGPHLVPAEPAEDLPCETFRVLKNKEEKAFGEYRTRRLVLEAWERLEETCRTDDRRQPRSPDGR